MKVLITGGAGLIGSHIAESLLGRSDRALVLDNYSTGRRDNLNNHRLLTVIEGDIGDKPFVDKTFEEFRPDYVIHAAASYKNPDDWEQDTKTNVMGTACIVKAALRHEVKRLIYFQTSLCYGIYPKQQPVRIDYPLNPSSSSYAISKTAGENYIRLSGLDFISFRLANIIGPRNLSGPIPTFYQRLSKNLPCFVTDTRRDFIYVKDLVDLVLMALDGSGKSGIYHVSTGTDYAIREVFDCVVSAMKITPPPAVEVRPRNPDDAPTILLDPSRTHRDFNWKAKTPLETTISAAVAWYNEHGVQQAYTHLSEDKKNGK